MSSQDFKLVYIKHLVGVINPYKQAVFVTRNIEDDSTILKYTVPGAFNSTNNVPGRHTVEPSHTISSHPVPDNSCILVPFII